MAARAGVSVAVASGVLHGARAEAAVRERVLRAVREIGYRPAPHTRPVHRPPLHLLGVQYNLQQPFHTDLVAAMQVAAERVGYRIDLGGVAPYHGERHVVDALLNQHCGALITLGSKATSTQLTELAAKVPVVVVARRLRPGVPTLDVVRTAEERGARQAVAHLVGLGHRDIVHIDGGRAPNAAERRGGYRVAMNVHGLGGHADVLSGGQTETDGAAAVRALLNAGGRVPTAVLTFNDRCALGAIDVLRSAGITIPGQVSVVAFADSRPSQDSPTALTAVVPDVSRLAEHSVGWAVARLEGRQTSGRETLVAPLLLPGATAAAARAD
ncbi:LacI family DNA-binding transcriptional regulator [Streptomyces sp. NPDC005728]|uniref:LacI family DNA-binding transcriptional regulator n=1 Tax=Streptomyces sp. NPDC005728 TaxID=3157054 RepID=UPI0033D31023